MPKDPWVIQKAAEEVGALVSTGSPSVLSQAVAEPEIPSEMKATYYRAKDYAFQKKFYGYLVSTLIERVGRAEAARDRQYEYNVEQIAKQAALEAELKRLHTLRPASEWHEDYGTVL